MRRLPLIAAVTLAATLAGCAGTDGERRAAPLPQVRLDVTAPRDGAVVRGGTVDVRGRVSPAAAQVSVLGRPALVTQGRFTVVVPLEPGMNVVDIAATARHRRPTFAALRVTRQVNVEVPELAGLPEEELDAELRPLGLRADVERDASILDIVLSGPRLVCAQDPPSGTTVRRGSAVHVVVSKRC